MKEKKRKPWSDHARKNHADGVRRYREQLEAYKTYEWIRINLIEKGVPVETVVKFLEAALDISTIVQEYNEKQKIAVVG